MSRAIKWILDVVIYRADERGYVPIGVEYLNGRHDILHVTSLN